MSKAFHLNERTGHYLPLRPLTDSDIIDLAKKLVSNKLLLSNKPISSPSETKDFLKIHLGGLEHETFTVIFLDNRHRIITYEHMFRGTIDGASVYPREVVKEALKHNAAAVILAHNHPSGVAEPSISDKNITQRLKDALNLVDVRVLDHFVIGTTDVVSFAERGLI